MSLKRDLLYYEERLKDRSLLHRAITVTFPDKRYSSFLCVPCGGDRITGFTHFFPNKTQADFVYRTLFESGECFPSLRIEPVVNMFDEHMFIVKWGVEEPERWQFDGWDYEVAIAQQLGYNEECMDAHYERYCKFYSRI